ncbi:MAG TPA: LamG domain-containing protein, partial [Bacillota bacterium]|nr:LamG domain-containing protein [Bacillota bacterium]
MLPAPGRAGCVSPPAGILAWWAGEGSGADALGLNSGTLQGGVTFAPGQVGQTFVFNGTNSFLQVPDSRLLSPHVGPSGELTLEAWVLVPRLPRFDTPTSQPNRAIAVKGSPGQWEYGFSITTNAQPAFSLWQSGGSGYSGASGAPLTTNAWHHLVGVLRKGQFVRLYVDGQLAGESTSFSGDTFEGSSPLYIGRRGDGQYFDGSVDELSLDGRALSSAEIAALYAAGPAGKCPSLTGAP